MNISSKKREKNVIPWTNKESFPFLYCVTLCKVCFLQLECLQNVLLCLGTLTYNKTFCLK